MFTIGNSLDRDAGPLPSGATPRWVAEVLMMGARRTWQSAIDRHDPARERFAPFAVLADGAATPGTGDVPANEEAALRALAVATRDPLIAARIFDFLWERFRKHADAGEAVRHLIAYAKSVQTGDDWPDAEDALGRAATLVALRKDSSSVPMLLEAFEHVGSVILASTYWYAFPKLADTFNATVLASKVLNAHVPDDAFHRWTGTVEWIGESFFNVDAMYGESAYLTLGALFASRGGRDDHARSRVRLVQHLLGLARSAPSALLGASHAERALDHALAFGLGQFVEQAKLLLHQRVLAAPKEMVRHSVPFQVAPEMISFVEDIVSSAPSPAAAVRSLAAVVGLQELPIDDVKAAATRQAQLTPFLSLVPAAAFRDGKVAHRAQDGEARLAQAVGRIVAAHLVLIETMLNSVMGVLSARLAPATLYDAVARWPGLRDKDHAWFSRASERFHAGDWMSSGLIVAMRYEAMLRQLARTLGHSALKTDAGGILSDETLGSLLQNNGLRAVLGADHMWFVEQVLCRPALGPNLRNELGHGNAAPWDLTPARVLWMWLLVVRLTFYGPEPAAEVAQGVAKADEST